MRKRILSAMLMASLLSMGFATDVRFIGYAVPTSPKGLIPVGDISAKGSVVGYFGGDEDNLKDIHARADILVQAVKQADEKIELEGKSDSDVVNVFVAPEFFFPHIYGAYIWTSNGHEKSPALELQEYLKSKLISYNNWIIVAGSILTADTKFTTPNINVLLDLPSYKEKNELVNSYYSKYLESAKAREEHAAESYAKDIQDYLEKVLSRASNQDIQNTAIIIDNTANRVQSLSTQKEYISNEDFPLSSGDSANKVLTEQMTRYPEIERKDGTDIKKDQNDAYAIFMNNNFQITTGMEICLDHAKNRLRSRMSENTKARSLDLQLIPSAGMEIHADAVVAKNNGFVFNVDGGYQLSGSAGFSSIYNNYKGNKISIPFKSQDYPNGKLIYGAHSQLARVKQAAKGNTPGLNNATFYDTSSLEDIDQTIVHINDQTGSISKYYAGGNGDLHIYGLKNPINI